MTAVEALRQRLPELGAEAVLVSQPANVRYLSGFRTPADGRVLLTLEDAWLLTDGRYAAQAAEESSLEAAITSDWKALLAERVGARRLAVEADDLTLEAFDDLRRRLEHEPVRVVALLQRARQVKRDDEIDALRRAARITDEAFEHILGVIRPGVREVEVALELERVMRLAGAEAKSFDIVVASGLRSAMPHGVASQKAIEAGDLVTLDFGACVDGYHADMTRAVAVGDIDDDLRRMFDAVLDAQQTALERLAPGVLGSDVDALARETLERHGLAEHFSHSLGHGVGLQIHEGPRLARTSDDRMEAGMVVTVEPGVYLPGRGGVRIEDLALITPDGYERLSLSPKAFVQVG